MNDPILRAKEAGGLKTHATGGLHYLRGNRLPHFSLTMGRWEMRDGAWREDSLRSGHRTLLALWPDLKPVADLHLSDMDGVPMHAEGNGWYWMAGASPVLGAHVRYRGGNSKIQHWKADGSFDGYREPTHDEALAIFAKHARVSFDDALALRAQLTQVYLDVPQYERVYRDGGTPAARAAFAPWIEAQKPRWKAEADACIAQFGLVVYGDPWSPPVQP